MSILPLKPWTSYLVFSYCSEESTFLRTSAKRQPIQFIFLDTAFVNSLALLSGLNPLPHLILLLWSSLLLPKSSHNWLPWRKVHPKREVGDYHSSFQVSFIMYSGFVLVSGFQEDHHHFNIMFLSLYLGFICCILVSSDIVIWLLGSVRLFTRVDFSVVLYSKFYCFRRSLYMSTDYF